MLKLSSTVRLFGATTGGATGNPDHELLSDGTQLRHSTWLLTLADRETVLEWNGIEPDTPVEFLGAGTDEVMDAALTWLEAETRAPP